MTFELDAEHLGRFPLMPVGAHVDLDDARHRRLFIRKIGRKRDATPFCQVAHGAEKLNPLLGFLLESVADLDIVKRGDAPLTREDIIRHTATGDQSVYFVDPWGNSIEIITEMTEDTIEKLGSGDGLYPA